MSTTKKRGLGRGLDALLAAAPALDSPDRAAGAGITSLSIDHLQPNRFQPRTYFDDDAIAELAESIRIQGIVQPLIVTPAGEGRYSIIAGERHCGLPRSTYSFPQRQNESVNTIEQACPIVIRESIER